jgi:hypothetical protein
VGKEEFNQVVSLEEAKDVWTTLRMAHEGLKPVRKVKIDMLEGQLNRFVMFDDKTPQGVFNHLKKLVNKAKALGSKKWIDRILTEQMMRAHDRGTYLNSSSAIESCSADARQVEPIGDADAI